MTRRAPDTGLPPGPQAPPLVQTLKLGFQPMQYMQECRKRFGDNFTIRPLAVDRPMVMVSDPAVIKAVYTEPSHGLLPGRNTVLNPVLGSRSLLLLEGADHLAHRKVMSGPFHGRGTRSYAPLVEEIVGAEIDSWPLEREFRIHARMQALTLEIILRVVFGVTDPVRLERMRELFAGMLGMTARPVVQLIGMATRRLGSLGPWRRLEGKLRAIDDLLYAEIAERRDAEDLAERTDILSLMMLARFEDGSGMSDTDLRDELMTLLLAGHETTATALAWTFDLLLRHAEPLRRLRRSLDAGEEDYLRATIAESQRLRPVLQQAGRRLAKDLEADGLSLPAGTDVAPAIWLAHTRAETYPEPFAFRPERFLGRAPDTYSWIPYGGGVHRCMGAAFAEFEMQIVLREALTRCELRKARPLPGKPARRNVVVGPHDGTPIVVTAREAVAA